MSVTQKLASGTWRRYSADDGGYYFHNEETDQSVWDPPPGWQDPEQAAPASPSSAAGDTSVSRSGTSVTGRQNRPSEARTSTAVLPLSLAGTDMHPGEVAAMRAQAGSTTGPAYSPKDEPEPRRQKPKTDILRSSSESRRSCSCNCCANITLGSCLLYLLIFFGIATAVVLAVVLTLPQTVSCDSGDEGYFVKEVASPVLYDISDDSFCTSLAPYNITITGASFLKYNDDKPTIKIGSWSIPATYLYHCSDVDVRKQDVSQCDELIVTIPVDDGSHGGGAVTFSVVNKQPDSPHPVAKVTTSTSCNTVNYPVQVLVVPSPRVDSFSPSAICGSATSTFTLTGDFFLQLRVDNTSSWEKPWIVYSGTQSGIISPDQITLSGCTNLTIGPSGVAGYQQGQLCTMLIAQVQANTLYGLITAEVANPGPNQCQQSGNTTFFSAPSTSVQSAEPPSACWALTGGSTSINLTGTFVAETGTGGTLMPPNVLVDGQPPVAVTPLECTPIMTNSGHSWNVCNKLQVDFNIVNGPSGASTFYYPTFTIYNDDIPDCGGSWTPLALVAPPSLSAYPTILPVICNPGAFVTIRLGGTFIKDDASLQFGFGGGSATGINPVPNPNLFDCYNPDGQQNSPVTLCRGVDLTVPNTTMTGNDKASVINTCLSNPALTSFNIVQVPGGSTIGTDPASVACSLPFNFTVVSGVSPSTFYRIGGTFYNSFQLGTQWIGAPDIFEDPAVPCNSAGSYDTCTSLIVRVTQKIGFNTGANPLKVSTGTCLSGAASITINGPCT